MELAVVVLSGPVAAGKTHLARRLEADHGFTRLSTRQLILAELPETPATRRELQLAGERLDTQTGGDWVVLGLLKVLGASDRGEPVVIDSARREEQIVKIRRAISVPVLHVHVMAPFHVLRQRYAQYFSGPGELPNYEKVLESATESQVGRLADVADLLIDSEERDVAEAVDAIIAALGAVRRG